VFSSSTSLNRVAELVVDSREVDAPTCDTGIVGSVGVVAAAADLARLFA